MKLIDKATGETITTATDAGGQLLLKRGTHELPSKPKTKTAQKKKAETSTEE